MKKIFTALMVAAMVLSTGCGNQAQEAAKDAQQKVEQKADEAKETAKQAADDAAKKVEQKVEENANAVKEEAQKVEEKTEQKIQETAQQAQEVKQELEAKVGQMEQASVSEAMKAVSFNGVAPTMHIDEAKKILGEPTAQVDDDEFAFSNGLIIEIDKGTNLVEKIKIRQAGVPNAKGVEVGMMEYVLNEKCGPADKIEIDDGEVEYKYYDGGKQFKTVYTSRGGIITEIETEVDD